MKTIHCELRHPEADRPKDLKARSFAPRSGPLGSLRIALCFFSFILFSSSLHAADVTLTPPTNDGENILVFRNADIRDVLSLIADEYDLNIVMSDEVSGQISLRLRDASLNNTLDSILIARGFDYEIRDNVIRVAPTETIEAERAKRLSKEGLEALVSEVIVLRYLDANDVKSMVNSMLTSRGSVSVLEKRTYKGFQFGAQMVGNQTGSSGSGSSSSSSSYSGSSSQTGALLAASQASAKEPPRANTLMVVDVRSQIDRIKGVIEQVDISPRQILIDSKILEVNTNSLEDLGLDLNNDLTFAAGENKSKYNPLTTDLNASSSNSTINSGVFSNTFPANTDSGIHAVFQHLNGEDFTIILHALLQDKHTKTLSAPKILTLENQEAAILVGERYPIYEANVSDQGTVTETLSFYQPVGISLQVIAQVTPEKDIIMIIHPTVSSIGDLVRGTSGLTQPRINVREADTRVLIKNGETLVIGGLLEDVDDRRYFNVPLLERVPLISKLFNRRQVDIDQRNLLIFITPRVVDEGKLPLSEAEQLRLNGINDPARYGTLYDRRAAVRQFYNAAEKNYKSKKYEVAKAQFLKVLSMEPQHSGAIKYLKKLNALPNRYPV
ncbi:MAG: secretin and TonB N-terminal domain-containing protein [Candidatus Omnitrophica bacterium]|nr:secretin and TonB N-terminal domain-containing protein [Candidatus Omnitrophota bacterium]